MGVEKRAHLYTRGKGREGVEVRSVCLWAWNRWSSQVDHCRAGSNGVGGGVGGGCALSTPGTGSGPHGCQCESTVSGQAPLPSLLTLSPLGVHPNYFLLCDAGWQCSYPGVAGWLFPSVKSLLLDRDRPQTQRLCIQARSAVGCPEAHTGSHRSITS